MHYLERSYSSKVLDIIKLWVFFKINLMKIEGSSRGCRFCPKGRTMKCGVWTPFWNKTYMFFEFIHELNLVNYPWLIEYGYLSILCMCMFIDLLNWAIVSIDISPNFFESNVWYWNSNLINWSTLCISPWSCGS